MIGVLIFGVAVLHSDATAILHLGTWLLIAALPVGLPFAISFTTYVMDEGADPWAGLMLFYGLAWIAFGRFLWNRRIVTGTPNSGHPVERLRIGLYLKRAGL